MMVVALAHGRSIRNPRHLITMQALLGHNASRSTGGAKPRGDVEQRSGFSDAKPRGALELIASPAAEPVAEFVRSATANSAQSEASGWKVTVGVCMAGACAFLNLYATQPLLPFLERSFHATKAEAGMTVSAAALAVALSAPLIGTYADRIGRKRIIVPAIFVLAIITVFAATANNLVELSWWRFAQGIVLPAVFAITMAYVTEEWSGNRVGMAMATFVSGNVIGGFVGRLLAGMVADSISWRASFIALGAITLVGGALTWWLLPASQKRTRPAKNVSIAQAMLTQLKNPKLAVTFTVGASVLFSIVAAFSYVNYHLAKPPYNFSSSALSLLFAVYLVGAFINPFAGKMIDKLGFRKAYSAAITASALGLCLTLSPNIVAIIVGLAIFCSGIFICQSATTSSLRVFAPTDRSTAAGIYVCFYYLGGSLGGYLPSLLWDWGGWSSCVALVVGVQLVALCTAWTFWKAE